MPTYLIDSFRGGISDFEDKGNAGGAKLIKGLDIRKRVDSLTCTQATVNETGTSFTDLIKWFVSASDGKLYAFDAGGKIYRRSVNSVPEAWSNVYTDADGAILGAAEFFVDNGNKYLAWATATKLHTKVLPGSGFADVDNNITNAASTVTTWPKSNLTTSAYHTMAWVNGVLLIANAQYVAMVGYDASYTNQALNIFPGNVIKAILERGTDAVLGSYRTDYKEESGLWQWDQIADNYQNKKFIPIENLNALIDIEIPIAQVGSNGQLFYSDLLNQLPITRFPGGGQVNPGGVCVDDGVALFGVYGADEGYNGIWSYGRKDLSHPRVLTLEYPFECDEIGALTKSGSHIVFSYQDGSTYGVKRIDSTTKAVGYYYSLDLKAPVGNIIGSMPIWQGIRIWMAPLPSGCSVEAFYKLDKSGSWIQAKTLAGDTAFTTENGKEAIFFAGDKGQIFEFYLKLTPSSNNTPEIYKAELMFNYER